MSKFTELQEAFDKSLESFKEKISTLRTGRAVPALVEKVKVEAYGTLNELKTLASISAPEPRQLIIQPFDPSVTQAIEQGISKANLGLSPVVDKNLIRISIPPLNEESRQILVKELKKMAEEARVSLRKLREDTMKTLKADQASGKLSEDDFYTAQREIQTLIDEYNTRIEDTAGAKEQEIMTI